MSNEKVFSTSGARKTDNHSQKYETGLLSHTIKKLTWNGSKFKYKTWNCKKKKKKTGKKFLSFGLGNNFVTMTPKAHTHTQELTSRITSNLKASAPQKEAINEMKMRPAE